MKIFCHHCGYKVEYTGKKPNFCSGCGAGLAIGSKPPVHPVTPSETFEEDEPKKNYDELKKLDIEIIPAQDKNMTVGDIGLQRPISPTNNDKDFRTLKTKKLSKKAFLESF